MTQLTYLKQTTLPPLLGIVLFCFGFLPLAQAVSPTPDGCYPNYTTAEGCKALQSLTAGIGNTGVGWFSLFLDTTGSSNTAIGTAAMLLNTTGHDNIAVGTDALVYADAASYNSAVGSQALFRNTTG